MKMNCNCAGITNGQNEKTPRQNRAYSTVGACVKARKVVNQQSAAMVKMKYD